MELVVTGLMFGFGSGAVVGWIAGRLAGIGEGRYRARRDLARREVLAPLTTSRGRYGGGAELEQDSMAEFADAAQVGLASARRALDAGRNVG